MGPVAVEFFVSRKARSYRRAGGWTSARHGGAREIERKNARREVCPGAMSRGRSTSAPGGAQRNPYPLACPSRIDGSTRFARPLPPIGPQNAALFEVQP